MTMKEIYLALIERSVTFCRGRWQVIIGYGGRYKKIFSDFRLSRAGGFSVTWSCCYTMPLDGHSPSYEVGAAPIIAYALDDLVVHSAKSQSGCHLS